MLEVMTARLLAEPCPLCCDADASCRLCLGELETAHERALEAEGDRLALTFAERGHVAEVPCEPGQLALRRE
jgi:hypothetical protein